jgi:hypothetical protein
MAQTSNRGMFEEPPLRMGHRKQGDAGLTVRHVLQRDVVGQAARHGAQSHTLIHVSRLMFVLCWPATHSATERSRKLNVDKCLVCCH